MEELLVLPDQGVARLDEDADEGFFVEGGERGGDGDAADEFGDEAVGLEVGGLEEVERVVLLEFVVGGGGGEEGEVFLEELAFLGAGADGDGGFGGAGGGGGEAGGGADGGVEADAAFGEAVHDGFLEADEGAAADEEDVVGADGVGLGFGGAGGGVGTGGGGARGGHDAAGEGAVGGVVG